MSNTTGKPFRPMLAYDADIEHYKARIANGEKLYGSYKLDGIRAMVIDGQLISRTLKPIPNKYCQRLFGRLSCEGLDGELVVGNEFGDGVFARTSSGVMSHEGMPQVSFRVFDLLTVPANTPFEVRMRQLGQKVAGLPLANVAWVIQYLLDPSHDTVEKVEAEAIDLQYEGLIIRSADSPYKQGRSTLREGYMGKLKRFMDSEAVITGFEEMMHNDNPATTDARGFTVRSSHQAHQRGAGVLGTLRVTDIHKPEWSFGIGSGFDLALRACIWKAQDEYLGKVVKYKYLPVGTLELPRHPVFLGFRPEGA
jgi:DNA ligase-1